MPIRSVFLACLRDRSRLTFSSLIAAALAQLGLIYSAKWPLRLHNSAAIAGWLPFSHPRLLFLVPQYVKKRILYAYKRTWHSGHVPPPLLPPMSYLFPVRAQAVCTKSPQFKHQNNDFYVPPPPALFFTLLDPRRR